MLPDEGGLILRGSNVSPFIVRSTSILCSPAGIYIYIYIYIFHIQVYETLDKTAVVHGQFYICLGNWCLEMRVGGQGFTFVYIHAGTGLRPS